MTAADYQITFPYGATDGTYYGPNGSIGPYHRGDDRAMPYGTPVVVNGVQIGLSGNGNGLYGALLHVCKFINGADVNPGGGGFNLSGAKVITVVNSYEADPVNAKYVRVQDSSGAAWVFLHMSQVDVRVDQILQGENMSFWDSTIDNKEEERQVFLAWCFRNPLPQEVGRYIGKKVSDVWPDIAKNATRSDFDKMAAAYQTNNNQIPNGADAVTLAPGKYIVNVK